MNKKTKIDEGNKHVFEMEVMPELVLLSPAAATAARKSLKTGGQRTQFDANLRVGNFGGVSILALARQSEATSKRKKTQG